MLCLNGLLVQVGGVYQDLGVTLVVLNTVWIFWRRLEGNGMTTSVVGNMILYVKFKSR